MHSGELRCSQGKLFGILVEGILEVRCQSKFCRPSEGMVLIHRFNLDTGEMLEDRKYRDPSTRKKGPNP